MSAVIKMTATFNSAAAFNQDLSKWDVSKVTDMWAMFSGASAFNQDLAKWDVSAVDDMGDMFMDAAVFDQDLSTWDVSKVTNMMGMFREASAFNQDLSKWDVSAVIYMAQMFYLAPAFNQKLCGEAWVKSKAGKNEMFEGSPGSISSTACEAANHGHGRDCGLRLEWGWLVPTCVYVCRQGSWFVIDLWWL